MYDQRLSRTRCISFGVGTIGVSVMLNTVTSYFPAMMSTVLGQNAAFAGVLITISKLYDIFADIAIGAASDRTRSRWGRRRPWMLIGSLVSPISLLLIFAPAVTDPSGLAIYMMVMLVIYATGYSLFNIPYLALPSEIAHSMHDRTRLMSYRTFAIAIGQILSLGLSAAILDAVEGAPGYRLMGLIMAAIVAVAMLISVIGVPNGMARQAKPIGTISWRREVASLLANRPFMILMTTKLWQYFAIALAGATQLLFMLNVLRTGYAGQIHLAVSINIALAISMPFWVRMAKRVGKRTAYQIATVMLALVYLSWLASDATTDAVGLWVRGIFQGIAAGGVMLMGVSMLPDTMEYDRLTTGRQREGVFSSLYAIMEKVSWAIAPGVIGSGLAIAGYIPTTGGKLVAQPDSATLLLYHANSTIPAACLLGSAVLLVLYHLDEAKLTALRERRSE